MVGANPEAVIETRGLRRVFKSRQRQVEAVSGVDLNVSAGEIFGFLGPNGAGKTTTLSLTPGWRRVNSARWGGR